MYLLLFRLQITCISISHLSHTPFAPCGHMKYNNKKLMVFLHTEIQVFLCRKGPKKIPFVKGTLQGNMKLSHGGKYLYRSWDIGLSTEEEATLCRIITAVFRSCHNARAWWPCRRCSLHRECTNSLIALHHVEQVLQCCGAHFSSSPRV